MDNIYYDRKAGRVVVRGGSRQPLRYFPDNQSLITTELRKIGTTPATTIGSLTSAIATISDMTGLEVGDHLVVNSKAALLAGIAIAYARVPAANTAVVCLLNPNAASVATQAAVGWDVLAIRSQAT